MENTGVRLHDPGMEAVLATTLSFSVGLVLAVGRAKKLELMTVKK